MSVHMCDDDQVGAQSQLPSNDSLVEPGVKSRRPKRSTSEVTESIKTWADNIKSSRKMLLTVQLSQNGMPAPAYTYLRDQLHTSGHTFNTRADILDSIIERMIEEEIVIPGHSSIENEWRRRLLCWYEGLSEEEKLEIPVFGNTISTKASLFKLDGINNLKWARREFPLVEQTFQSILQDLTRIGVIDPEYKSCEERDIEAEDRKQQASPDDSLYKALAELRMIPVSKFEDLVRQGSSRPFSSLLHLFAAASLKSKSSSGHHNFSEGHRFMVQHLKVVGFSGYEDLREYITPSYLLRFRKYLADLLESGSLASQSANSVLSAVRSTFKRSVGIKGLGLSSFIDVEGFPNRRDTDQYRPYPPFVRKAIQHACDVERATFNELAKDYVPFHGGSDPLDEHGNIRRGMATLENARWIFENKLACRAIGQWSANAHDEYEKGFLRLVKIVGLGIVETYASWGVIYQVTSRMIAPYITRLAQLTGLNADSLKSLDVDDFVERHPLTHRPYLRYWKERSGGEKNLHLELMDADVTWLTLSQSAEIKKIFDEVIHLTRRIRERAVGTIQGRLFVYESQKQNEFRKVKSFENSTVVNNVMNQLARDHCLQTEDGDDVNISASRLRPSLVADLVGQGVPLREIQVILGHKTITTTMNYLDNLEFGKTARQVVIEALKKIHKGTILQESSPSSQPSPAASSSSSAIIIKTGLVSCRNVFDPPEDIRKLQSYKKGNPCSLLNKCLSCSNSIITVSHLPDLFVMQWEYASMMSTSSVAETPYGYVIRENLEVLNSILTPSVQGFTAEQLEEARRLAQNLSLNPMIEGVSL